MSTSVKPIKISNVNYEQLTISELKATNPSNPSYKRCFVNYKNGTSTQFNVKLMNVKFPFGINYSEEYKTYKGSVVISENEYNSFIKIEEKLKELALPLVHKELKSTTFTMDKYEESILKPPREDSKYQDFLFPLKFGKDANSDTFYTKIYNQEGQLINMTTENYLEVLPKGCVINVVLSASFYKLAKKFGVTWKPLAVYIVSLPVKTDSFDLNSDSEEDDTIVENVVKSDNDSEEEIQNEHVEETKQDDTDSDDDIIAKISKMQPKKKTTKKMN